ncbi:MAG: cytochrome c maturation protein CcmE [Anaerolineae bacterium]
MQGPACTDDDVQLKKARGLRRKFLIGGLVVVAVVVYLIASSIGGSTAYYLTVEELKAQGASLHDRNVRVAGVVDGASIQYDARNLLLTFDLVDASGRLPVVYKGVRPDMFQGGAEAVVEGRYRPDGTFEATNLLLKCPSKYEEAATAEAQGR